MIRVKLKCKNPKRIPLQRVMVMGDKLYLISFKMEGVEQVQESDAGEDEDKGDDEG